MSPYRILFVCLGNICRSPAAEIVCRAALREADMEKLVEVDSCGTAAYHVGSRPDARMLAALQRAGFAAGSHRARQLSPEDGSRFHLIIPQDSSNLRDVQDMLRHFPTLVLPMKIWFPEGCTLDGVPDPYYGGASGFDDVVSLLSQSMPSLITFLREQLGIRE